ncbi:MAG TPA: sulfatase-like hydrolase/transferase, partial [Pirellulaceae bacterium]|nr:sulfatase-like hydrolase/transferase [Pirellulaceae bacterium]
QQLADDGLANDTVVFFWGDHGRGLPRAKRWTYDSGIHVPLIVRWPGKLASGSVREDLVALLDLGPTVLTLAQITPPSHMQGRPMFDSQARPPSKPRDYVYAARDRMDEAYDVIRAVRGVRFKYIRNYQPETPYSQPISYMDEMPTMREWRRLAAAGQLVGPQRLFFQPTKPLEELYDTDVDPHEINNLADDPTHRATLERMRAAHEAWMRDTRDLGLVSESELNERARPGGQWAVTATPAIRIAGGKATLTCETPGASIAWTFDDEQGGKSNGKSSANSGKNGSKGGKKGDETNVKANSIRWQLYTGPFDVPPGRESSLRAVACRLGYRDSREARP